MDVGGSQCGDSATDNVPEFLIFHGSLGNDGKIPGGGVVLGVGESVTVGKMGAGAAQFLCLFVHQLHEFLPGAADVFRHHVGGFTGGYHQQRLKQPMDAHGLAHNQIALGGSLTQIGKGGGLDRYHILGIAVFQAQICSHNFCGAGRVVLFIRLVLIQRDAGVHIHQICGIGCDGNIVGSGSVLLNEHIAGNGGNHKADHKNHGQQKGQKSFHAIASFSHVILSFLHNLKYSIRKYW